MILAAGLGTRLRPLTNDRPKALVEVAGRTLLDITVARLRSFGVREVIVNVHHFADRMLAYLKANHNFGIRIEVSREEQLLDTGGGLKKAAWFFLEPGSDRDQPFILHNVDVLSTIDLARMVRFHKKRDALATMAVQSRPTSRTLLFDKEGLFRGRGPAREEQPETVQPPFELDPLAFSGIHVLSPGIFEKIQEKGAFSIIDAYVRLAAMGETIAAFRADGAYWSDLGKPENVAQAALDVEAGACIQDPPDAPM
jgi:NDP-sugar pyrophosphorylase family protein